MLKYSNSEEKALLEIMNILTDAKKNLLEIEPKFAELLTISNVKNDYLIMTRKKILKRLLIQKVQ